MSPKFTYPFETSRQIGTVIEVQPSYVRINLPGAASVSGGHQYGANVPLGEVGEFVFLDAGAKAILGRILEIRLPERDRLSVERPLEGDVKVHPVARVQMLVSLSITEPLSGKERSIEGISSYPRLGARAFSASPNLMAWVAECAQRSASKDVRSVMLGVLPATGNLPFYITPERLLGRHAAVLGTTGGGKSWTVARIIEELSNKFEKSKIILVDPTGEYWSLPADITMHQWVGLSGPPEATDANKHDGAPENEFCFPYTDLTENDLFAIFRPSKGSQTPKLRAAIKSLKLAQILGNSHSLVEGGCIPKSGKNKKAFYDAYKSQATLVDSTTANFDIRCLVRQIEYECVWPSGGTGASPNPAVWGRVNEGELSYCNSLIARISSYISEQSFSCLFKPETKATPFAKVLSSFLSDSDKRILRLCLSTLPTVEHVRELLVNAIGRSLLEQGRSGVFRNQPILVILDEAHQFLSKTLGEEDWSYRLDAFDGIAKEGRKYCLSTLVSTQRPRDIPEGVLSQIGSLIVHRLINDADLRVVERACGEIDRTASEFLPVLGPGEAIIVGVDVPFPISIKVSIPIAKPRSDGPNFQKHWAV